MISLLTYGSGLFCANTEPTTAIVIVIVIVIAKTKMILSLNFIVLLPQNARIPVGINSVL